MASAGACSDKGGGAFADQRVDDAVQRREPLRMVENGSTQAGAVQGSAACQHRGAELFHHLRQARRAGRHDVAGEGVGVDENRAEFTQACGNH